MRVVVRSLCGLILVAAVAGAGRLAEPRDSLVVSTAWLAQHLEDPNLVVLFVGDDNEYNKAHIPGAFNMQIEDFAVDEHSGNAPMLEVLPVEALRARLGAFGITERSRIIVHAGKDFVPFATRVILTLDYAGFGDRTSLLDGGTQAWVKEGRPVTDVVPKKVASTLGPLHVNPVIVDAEYVKARIGKPGVSIVDGRAAAFYDGVSTGSGHAGSHRSGHIASAKSVPYIAPYGEGDVVKSTAELRAMFTKAGVTPGDTVVGYCHIGLQATAMLFAARLLGHPVRLFDGSFDEWSKLPVADHPVEMSPAKKS